MRPLQRPCNEALTDIFNQGLLYRYIPILALEIIWWLARPDLKDLIDRLQKHRVAVGIEIAEHFRVRQQPAGADTKDQATIEHVVEHCDRGGQRRRMGVRHV